jgi:asparagine synthase (glutamine-hydrolysing)
MRRLAVVDVKGGDQPRKDFVTGALLFYNGEVYNHCDLAHELRRLGRRMRGRSDSEVVLQAYLTWGQAALHQLNGMFAFAIWQPREGCLHLVRDRLGQKPLYFWQDGPRIVFGSEVRTVLAHPLVPKSLDQIALAEYLQLRHVPSPSTLIEGIRALEPGTLLRVQLGKPPTFMRWWQTEACTDPRLTLDTAVEEFKSIWPSVVRRHLISDVPVGAFLSGGIDSGLVVSQAARSAPNLKTFSIRFKEHGFDETEQARQIARDYACEHHVIPFEDSFESLLEQWLRAYDQPLSDPATFPSLVLAREARPQVVVALTGDGGDELFAGYQRYRSTLFARRLLKLPLPFRHLFCWTAQSAAKLLPAHIPRRRWLDAIARRLRLLQSDLAAEYVAQFGIWEQDQLAEFVRAVSPAPKAQFQLRDPLRAMLDYDLHHWLPDQMLVKMDRATMSHSLEARLPLLDNEVLELSRRIPSNILLGRGTLKRVLRTVAAEYLPGNIAQRPKHGFAVPVDKLLRENMNFIGPRLNQGANTWRDLLRGDYLMSLWTEHISRRANHGERILTTLLFFAWAEDNGL